MSSRPLSTEALRDRRQWLPGKLDGPRLRARRQRTGMTLTVFAVAIGLSESQARNLELGNKQPSPETLARIALHFDCDPADLLVGEEAA